MKPINIGLLGIGTVGSGTFAVLKRNQAEIARRAGREIVIKIIADRDIEKARRIAGDGTLITSDANEVVTHPDVDIVVELIGGYTTAKELTLKAIENGKHVVTANKAMLASHGTEIFAAAEKQGVMVAFEAAVAGGIPIIKALREGLTANRIEWIAGIINGTGNFILSEMRSKGLSFDTVLNQAQELGYAEADPTFDIEGIDAAHKISIMASIAFGIPIQFDKVELRVHPTLIPSRRLIANVEGVMNAVVVKGDAVGPTLYYGPGAGAEPTASAVVADLVDVTRMHTADPKQRVPYLGVQPNLLLDIPILPMEEVETSYYLRLQALDRPGVLADITCILAELEISIDAMIQKEPKKDEEQVDIIVLTHLSIEKNINAAITRIEELSSVMGKITRIRLEELSSK